MTLEDVKLTMEEVYTNIEIKDLNDGRISISFKPLYSEVNRGLVFSSMEIEALNELLNTNSDKTYKLHNFMFVCNENPRVTIIFVEEGSEWDIG